MYPNVCVHVYKYIHLATTHFHAAERLSVSPWSQTSATLYTLLSATSTCSSPRWQRSKTQTTCRSSSSLAVAKMSPAGKHGSHCRKPLAVFCITKFWDWDCGHLAEGQLSFRWGDRCSRTTGRTAWCCHAPPLGGPPTVDYWSSAQGHKQHWLLSACLCLKIKT